MTATARKEVSLQPDARLPNGPEDDVGDGSALEAIRSGKDLPILVEYLRFSEDLSPNVLSALVSMLNLGSDHPWRLHLKYRHRGNPQKTCKYEPDLINSTLERISREPMSVKTARELAEMLDPESRHQFRLSLRKRNRGPISRRRFLNMEIYFKVAKALKSKEPIKNLVIDLRKRDGIDRKTFFAYKKIIERNKGEASKRSSVQNLSH